MMEVRAKVTETDRDNLQAGQPATVQVDALPGRTFAAKVGALSGSASRGNFFETSAIRQFDISLQLDKPDPQMRAGSSLRVVIDGREIQGALHIPRQAVFEKNGKNFVFLQVGPDRFDRRDIKVENRTESRAVVSGLNEGDVIALDRSASGSVMVRARVVGRSNEERQRARLRQGSAGPPKRCEGAKDRERGGAPRVSVGSLGGAAPE